MANQWIVYMVRCADASIYTGITNNLEKRIAVHNNGTGAKYTKVRLPVSLIYTESHPDRSSASKREAEIKKLSRPQKEELVDIQTK